MRLKSIAYHRNGCHGAGFYVMTFYNKIGDFRHHMIATAFVKESEDGKYTIDSGKLSVIDLDMAKKDNVTFSENSWRYEDFDMQILQWISEWRARQVELI